MNDSKYSKFDYKLSQKMLTLLKGGYPARLKKALIVTAPLWFPFNILRLFAREKLRDRAYMRNLSSWLLKSNLAILKDHMRGNSSSGGGYRSGGQTLEEFIRHLQRKGRRGLYEEYAEIQARRFQGTFKSSRLKSNQYKNRYSDVLCYDHSRVKLSRIDSRSDYINANFVDGYGQKNAFISTQGPLPETFTDFWRMIWEFQVGVIVMTTRTIEGGRVKCDQYWPKKEKMRKAFEHYVVSNDGVDNFGDYTITNLNVTDTKTNQTRRVYHMHFKGWPDYGVPHSAVAMLRFRDIVRDKQVSLLAGHNAGPPIVVHCSAGIGRTGTFITLDISICRLEATSLIDVRTTVEKIRSQRAHSIQMPDQYVFCHLALLEYALSRGLLQDVDLSGFDDSDSESE